MKLEKAEKRYMLHLELYRAASYINNTIKFFIMSDLQKKHLQILKPEAKQYLYKHQQPKKKNIKLHPESLNSQFLSTLSLQKNEKHKVLTFSKKNLVIKKV